MSYYGDIEDSIRETRNILDAIPRHELIKLYDMKKDVHIIKGKLIYHNTLDQYLYPKYRITGIFDSFFD